MRVTVSTELAAPADRVWQELQTARLFAYVTAPVLRFLPDGPPPPEGRLPDGPLPMRLRLFGVLPIGRHTLRISRTGPRSLRDDGGGGIATVWDHHITVDPIDDARCRYTDDVEVEAGALTPAVWAFAQLFYRHRQRRWRKLVRGGFAY